MKSSGVRIGTAAMTTKGWKEQDFIQLAFIIDEYLVNVANNLVTDDLIKLYIDMVNKLINADRKRM